RGRGRAPDALLPERARGEARAFHHGAELGPRDLVIDRRRIGEGGEAAVDAAMTRSRPTSRAYWTIRCATSSGCSMKFVVVSSTPGMITLPSGSLTSSNTLHSCA